MKRLFQILSPARRYHEHKTLASLLLRLLDVLLLVLPQRRGQQPVLPPRRVLLMNPAYIGDLLISTGVLPLIRRAYPQAEIGFVVGSWARQVVNDHPMVDHVHVVDTFRLNRSPIGLIAKLRQHLATQAKAQAEVEALGYDVAIDLFTGFPPLSWFAWLCAVPVRIGYCSRGFGALLTQAVSLTVRPGRHEMAYHADLLLHIGIDAGSGALSSALSPATPADEQDAAAKLGWTSLRDRPYIVIHPGAGEPLKEWPLEKWREVVAALRQRSSVSLLFTGYGTRETTQIERIIEGIPDCLNLSGLLNWRELGAVVAGSQLLLGVDSMSGHLAAGHGTSTVTLSTGMSDPARWKPANVRGTVLHTAPPCLPCLNRVGCDSMCCLRDIPSQDVVASVLQRLAA